MTKKDTAYTHLQFDIPASDIAAILHSHPLFAETDLAALTELLGRARLLTLHPGEVLLRQGEASDAAYIVIEGSASVQIETTYGRVNLPPYQPPLFSVRSASLWGSHVPPPSRPQTHYAFSASITATCKNSAARIPDFLPLLLNETRLKQSEGRIALGSVLTKCSPWAFAP